MSSPQSGVRGASPYAAVVAPPHAQPNDPLVRASRQTPFARLVLVELRKLTGTLSDRILLIVGPIVLLGFVPLAAASADIASSFTSAQDQIAVTLMALRLGHSVVHGALIKLVAGEWQHRGAQPTLLVQPSRNRYFLAQATVVVILWLCCATLQTASSLIFAPLVAGNAGTVNLLSYRVGWVLGVCFLGSLLSVMVALIVAMLVPNAAGALAIYYATVPLSAMLTNMAPKVLGWFDPLTPVAALAANAPIEGPVAPIVSLLLWAGLLAFAGYQVARRDVA
jgi:hypothetical protein